MRVNFGISIVLVAAVLAMPVVRASDIDLHWLWDDRCAACHGHAGDFSRKFLSVSSGELQGPHHVHDLRRFLHNHYLAGNEVDAVYNMLLAQANNQARFKGECASCHDTAAKFVRNSLELRDGVLCSRNSGRPVSRFLDHHMELGSDDVEFFINLLTRVAHEVYRP
jgi:cytochrome c553